MLRPGYIGDHHEPVPRCAGALRPGLAFRLSSPEVQLRAVTGRRGGAAGRGREQAGAGQVPRARWGLPHVLVFGRTQPRGPPLLGGGGCSYVAVSLVAVAVAVLGFLGFLHEQQPNP